MASALRALSMVLILGFHPGCGSDEALAPTPSCGPTLPPAGWPGEPGVLQLDAPLPSLPFTLEPHRAAPVLEVQNPLVLHDPKLVTVVAADDPLATTLL